MPKHIIFKIYQKLLNWLYYFVDLGIVEIYGENSLFSVNGI
jgi:hypothetical protein